MRRYIENMFRWTLDDDGDLTLSFIRIVHITYYKWTDSAILRFGHKEWNSAPKGVWRAIRTYQNR